MRKIFLHAGVIMALFATSCSRDKYADLNTDPDQIQGNQIELKTLFPTAAIAVHANDFEAYYDIHRNLVYWNQNWVPLGGNGGIITRFRAPISASNRPYSYENYYSRERTGTGGAMLEMRNIIDKMPAAEKAKFQRMRAITYIPQALAAFIPTDFMGDFAYTEGLMARYTSPALLTPKYDTQEAVFDTLNSQLKASVAALKVAYPVDQTPLGTSDLWFHGTGTEATNWIKAANSLRLRIAMRMLKRKPDAAKAIILEVLSDNVGPISDRAGNWLFKGGEGVANGGNYNIATGLSGNKNTVDFMYTSSDPRIRSIYQKTALTLAQFNAAKVAGTIPATEVYKEYVGRPTSPDAVSEPATRHYFNYITGTTMYPSNIQAGLYNRAIALGKVNYPVITYADVCFMRAELAARGITTEIAADWYNKGIEASCYDYNDYAKDALVTNFTAVTPAEITAYQNHPNIIYTPAKGIEQICVQQYINFWRNPYECWALQKRTGFPSQTGVVLQAEKIRSNGQEVVMPRRWTVFLPQVSDLNFENRKTSLDRMQADPEFGELNDVTGRVWWDKK